MLAGRTTLRLGGPAARFVRAERSADLIDAVRTADTAGEDVLVLGGGSNLVVADAGFDGTVIQVATSGCGYDRLGDGSVQLTVEAGVDWDVTVARTVAEDLGGLECLS
ncbi:MAG TPA: FAD-binding protein, partial [Pseudonocardiaceae bacterium]|nr:FAD-binding protein [Pseudonocardiaceae bacterium]